MSLVLLTIIPFNVFHDHEDKSSHHWSERLEGENFDPDFLAEKYGLCDHKIHVGQDQQICFLCHFAFVPSGPLTSISFSSLNKEGSIINYCDNYISLFTSAPTGTILNKGSPSPELGDA